ncbi:cytochrome P450 [Pseudonocardia eucalypti]|uniref:Cytochrome P450 n=1 Tax=Pseudonocardia eucalypti TaxID=648755 RepID=A0ABP9RB54_9PSEU|nr:cytochrome P450 [Pseudonocardia eucalypti]
MTMLMTGKAPTAPGDLPLLGHSLALLRRDRIEYLGGLRSIGDIVRIRIGTRPFFVLNSPDLVRTVMLEESKSFDRGRIFEKARPYVGNGLITAAGTEHKRQRRMVQPVFHRGQVERSVRVMGEVVREHAEAWPAGSAVEMGREMHLLASEIIGRTMFRSPEAREVIQLTRDELPALLRGLGQRTLLPDALARLPNPVIRRFDAACANLREAAARLVATYRSDQEDLGDFVSILMGAHDARTGSTLTDTEIRDQIMTLLISGIETPATVLTWVMYQLAGQPELQGRLRQEVDKVGLPFEPADLPALRLTEAVVQEGLRLHHPLWLLMRRAVSPVTLGGVRIAAGSEVIYSPVALHRDPAVFPDPLRFDPDRWLDATPRMRRSFIPFGLGGRQCIGDGFGMTQMMLTVAGIVAGRHLSLPPGFRPRTVISGIMHLARLPMIVDGRGD